MNNFEFVQSLRNEYGIALALDDGDDDGSLFDFCQYYGAVRHCDISGDDCSDDGCLWQCNDMGAPFFCTHHAFNLEGTDDQFVEAA